MAMMACSSCCARKAAAESPAPDFGAARGPGEARADWDDVSEVVTVRGTPGAPSTEPMDDAMAPDTKSKTKEVMRLLTSIGAGAYRFVGGATAVQVHAMMTEQNGTG